MASLDAQRAIENVKAAGKAGALSDSAVGQIVRWLSEPPFAAYRDRLIEDISAQNWKRLDDAFYAVLEFGTGGRRGRMYPVGTNVLNDRTIAESARGLADYVASKKKPGEPRSCVIARDTRHNSEAFAKICASVLAAADFQVYLFPDYRSTPLLSSAVRYLQCDAGIMITASHNPPSDNGFKCYAATGGQVVPPDDAGIIDCVRKASDREIPLKPYDEAIKDGSIKLVGKEIDDHYVNAAVACSVSDCRDLSIVYTPMHGVGATSVAEALRRAGFSRVNILASQSAPDGDFPNVPGHVSNPEIPKTLAAAIDEAKRTGADLVLASDPDADRIGVGLPVSGDPHGEWTTLDGNQIGALLAGFVIDQTKAAGKLHPGKDFLVTTLVTSGMARALAEREGVRVVDRLLVGFKWIVLEIDKLGPENFLFGFEESHGYLRGAYARDKDAAVASLLMAELAAECKRKGTTPLAYLDDLYRKVGVYGERLINKTLEGREGLSQIQAIMKAFRTAPPARIAGLAVKEVHDYKTHEIRDLAGKTPPKPLPDPSGDLLIFHLDAPGVRFAARPSGTEPKIKFYLFARTEAGPDGLEPAKRTAADRLDQMTRDIEQYIGGVLK